MLKIKVNQTEHDALPAHFQGEYKADGNGSFVLDTDQAFEDVTGLKSALANERTQHKATKDARTAAETNLATVSEERDTLKTRAGKPSEVEAAYQKKLDEQKLSFATREQALSTSIRKMLVDNVALQMAGEISTAPALIQPHILARLSAVEEEGVWLTRVLDKDGKVTANSVKELQQELIADAQFAPIIKGSSASGGGAAGSKLPAGGKKFGDMTESERVALHQKNPEEYRRLSAAHKAAAGK